MKNLVLLHGWGASGRIWQRQVEAFGEATPSWPRGFPDGTPPGWRSI